VLDLEVTVALQGTLDTFALPDVLRLLAATKKTGSLRISSDQGSGAVWFDDGAVRQVEAAHVAHATEPVDALFELLRFDHGTFTFEGGAPSDRSGDPADVEALLVAAEAILAEWREIAQVVPAMGAWVTLRRTLDAPSVTVPAEHWPTLVAVGAGATVAAIASELGLTELPVSRAVRDLHALGTVEVAAAAPTAEPPAPSEPPTPSEPLAASEPAAAAPGIDLFAPADVPPAGEAPADPLDEPADDEEPAATADDPAPRSLLAAPTLDDPDAPLPVARPLRARRPRHLRSDDDGPGEPEAFVPLELPGHGPGRSYDDDPDGEPAPPPGDPAELDALSAAFPGLAVPSGATEELADEAEAPHGVDGPADDDAPEAGEAGEAGADSHVNRGALLRFLSSVKT
jgi:hypothetical protein